jgi:bifunctional UDP-N-acetylglucosamine pyrophosphorylase/glucosamine-1-phosphate N-acetyltransferase
MAGHSVLGIPASDPSETLGVNDRAQLAVAEAILRRRINDRWMREGVTMTDPGRTYIDVSVELEPDIRILPGTMLEGRTVVGSGSVIGPDTRLVDTIVGERVTITSTDAVDAEIGDEAIIGPFTHLRPGARIGARARIGNFVEVKNSEIGEGAKASHLSYLGDAEVGPDANIGAGTITANYDGFQKNRTKIGEDAHIGSNNTLVAPVEVGDGAYTGAGSVVTRDVPPGALAKGVPAKSVEGWVAARRAGGAHDDHDHDDHDDHDGRDS